MSWYLVNGEERRLDAPYTFFLPHPDCVASLRVGDMAKLLFEYEDNVEQYGGERMWVSVDQRDGPDFEGRLLSDPCEKQIAKGDLVRFRAEHILDFRYDDDRPDPAFSGHREYWDRCLVDKCVLDDGVPVEYVYREEPEVLENDKHPDSGWRIRGRQGSDSDEDMEGREATFVALGAVLNRDDSWIDLIDAPVGSAFMRNFETDTYEPAS